MMLPKLLALSLAVAPNLVNAAIFPQDSLVKMLDHKGFKQAMKENVRLQKYDLCISDTNENACIS